MIVLNSGVSGLLGSMLVRNLLEGGALREVLGFEHFRRHGIERSSADLKWRGVRTFQTDALPATWSALSSTKSPPTSRFTLISSNDLSLVDTAFLHLYHF